ncbi:hypothetical protein GCM10027073_47680 [Streptomyces chlorus]
MALVHPSRHSLGGCLVQRGERVAAGGGDIGGGTGLDVGDPQRGAVRGCRELHGAAERLVLLAEPQVVAVLTDAGETVRLLDATGIEQGESR